MSCKPETTARPMRRLAWDGLAFDAPADWDLAFHDKRNGITRIRLEDEVAVRLDGEWMTPGAALDLDRITARFNNASRRVEAAARDSETLASAPEGWSAVLHHFPDGRRLGLVFFLGRADSLFAFFQVHLDPGSPGEARRILHSLMGSFQRFPANAPQPWACYDIALVSPPGFSLSSTAFNPGLKRFTFVRFLRLLHVWHVSLADLALKNDRCPADWAARFLNAQEQARGPVFVNRNGQVAATRPGMFHLCHFTELARGCFRYKVALRHDPVGNRLVLACYQYRRESDLAWLKGSDLPAFDQGLSGPVQMPARKR